MLPLTDVDIAYELDGMTVIEELPGLIVNLDLIDSIVDADLRPVDAGFEAFEDSVAPVPPPRFRGRCAGSGGRWDSVSSNLRRQGSGSSSDASGGAAAVSDSKMSSIEAASDEMASRPEATAGLPVGTPLGPDTTDGSGPTLSASASTWPSGRERGRVVPRRRARWLDEVEGRRIARASRRDLGPNNDAQS